MRLDPTEKDPIKVADWAELNTLYSRTRQLSLEAVRSEIDIEGTLYEEPVEVDVPEVLPAELSEVLVASATAEIKRRIHIAGGAYPFELSAGVLKAFTDTSYMPYIFCLLVADREFYSPDDQQSAKLFEHLVCEALKVYLGGEAVRFGSRRDTMPQGIIKAVEQLAQLTGNRKLSNGYHVNATDQDLGLDAVAWKDFPDKHWGKVELYVQCATGQNWESKRRDFSTGVWSRILNWPFDPVVGLAIPYVVGEYDWERASSDVLLMDRIRIACVLRGQDLSGGICSWWDWCQDRIQEGSQRY